MLDRDIELARPNPKSGTDVPAARKARVERKRAIYQRHHRTEILADICQRISGIRQDGRVVPSYCQSPSGEIGSFAFACFRIFT